MSYKFHFSKSNSLNIEHLIPTKIILYSYQLVRKSGAIYLSIQRGYIYFHLSNNVQVTIMSIPTVSCKVYVSRLPIVI